MMSLKVKSRWVACSIHLAISVVILVALLSLIFFSWFPYDLIFAGGIDGLKILMGVDLVLGPLLTLIVFVPGKKGLKFDLTLIGITQLGCLLAGLSLVYNERPLAQVIADDGVHLLAASDYKYYKLQLSDLPGRSPKYVMLDLPEDRTQLGTIKFTTELVDKKPFVFRTDLYMPMNQVDEQRFHQRIAFIQKMMPGQELNKLSKIGKSDCWWIPILSKHTTGYACTHPGKGIIRLSERNF